MSIRPFRPPFWATNAHAQTLGARLLRPGSGPVMRRQRWKTPDGDFLDVDLGPDPGGKAPLVLVLHGLEGSSRRRYVLSACTELSRRGIRPVALNFRGCSGEPNLHPRFYHSGETGDPRWVLERLRTLHPERPLGIMGFSLGGNALLKLLGEDGSEAPVDAAAAMSVPFDLAAGSSYLERTRLGPMYAAYFLRSLRHKLRAKRSLIDGLIDVEGALRARTLRVFDDAATAPLHGFRDAADYYAASSSAAYLGDITVPTLVIHSVDDPFLPSEAIPRGPLHDNPNLVPVLTSRGGHVGFLEGQPWRPRLWGEEAAADFLSTRLGALLDSGGPIV